MDIGAVIKGPFEDQDWVKKLLLTGLANVLICFTIVGVFVGVPNLIGWGKAYAQERARGGSTLPEFGFGYIGEGYKVILGMMLFGFIGMLGVVPVVMLGVVLGQVAELLSLLVLPLLAAYYLLLVPLSGVILGRIYLDDDMMAGTGIVAAFLVVKDNPGPSLMYLLTVLAIGLVGVAMGFVPLVGGLVGAAFQTAAGAIAVVQFREALGGR